MNSKKKKKKKKTTSASSSNRLSLLPRLPGASYHLATDSEMMLTDVALPSRSGQFSPTHTYPPAPIPPHVGTRAPPPLSTVHTKLDQLARHPRLVISEFVLSPQTHHPTAAAPASKGLFSRVLRALQNTVPMSTMNSFLLSPFPDSPPPMTSTTSDCGACCGSSSRFGEFAGRAVGLIGSSSAHL